jgi:hypothetical protein
MQYYRKKISKKQKQAKELLKGTTRLKLPSHSIGSFKIKIHDRTNKKR